MCNIPLLSLSLQILEKYADNPHCSEKGVLLVAPLKIKGREQGVYSKDPRREGQNPVKPKNRKRFIPICHCRPQSTETHRLCHVAFRGL
jgi:hypothetical protein